MLLFFTPVETMDHFRNGNVILRISQLFTDWSSKKKKTPYRKQFLLFSLGVHVCVCERERGASFLCNGEMGLGYTCLKREFETSSC